MTRLEQAIAAYLAVDPSSSERPSLDALSFGIEAAELEDDPAEMLSAQAEWRELVAAREVLLAILETPR